MIGLAAACAGLAGFILGLLARKPVHRRTAATANAVEILITADTSDAQLKIHALTEATEALAKMTERANRQRGQA